MKVLLVNGSPHERGCTHEALCAVADVLREEEAETQLLWLGNKPVQDCIACGKCREAGRCVFEDAADRLIDAAKEADGFVFGSPVYYAHPSGRLLSVLDRAFYAGKYAFAGKPGASIVSARRGGTAASFDVVNKYFGISCMPVVSSTYWNMVYGSTPEEVRRDAEGMQTMRNLARNMAYLLRCVQAGKEAGILPPVPETGAKTNVIR